ncbi:tetratricopeptide repeat protein [Magnetococcales bacterium HHB-1]
MTSEPIDGLLTSLQIQLSRGEIDIKQVGEILKRHDLIEMADGMNVKTAIRSAFLCYQMTLLSPEESCSAAMVSFELAKIIQPSEVSFGLSIGIGHGISCSIYPMIIFAYQLASAEKIMPFVREAIRILVSDEEYHDLMELYYDIGLLYVKLGDESNAAKYFEKAVKTMDLAVHQGDLHEQKSSQAMVREDCKNVSDFSSFWPLDIIHSAEYPLILKERLASSLLHTGEAVSAFEYAKQSVAVFHGHKDLVRPFFGLRALFTYMVIAVDNKEFDLAIESAEEIISSTSETPKDVFHINALLVLSLCAKQSGDKQRFLQYQQKVKAIMQQDQLE